MECAGDLGRIAVFRFMAFRTSGSRIKLAIYVTAHAFKFAAKLDEAEAAYLMRVETKSGHSGATPTTKIEEYADIMAFVYKTLKIEKSNLT